MKKNMFSRVDFSLMKFCRNKTRRRLVACISAVMMVVGSALGGTVVLNQVGGVGGAEINASHGVAAPVTDGTTATLSLLSGKSAGLIDSKAMGGINGYAISAYTQYPNACLAFVEFATGYDMIMKRSEMLGIAPARADAAQAAGETSQQLFDRLEQGNIIIMPSVKAVGQIWTPGQTFFIDLAKDVFRPESEKKYTDLSAMKQGLEEMSQQIYDAIHTLN